MMFGREVIALDSSSDESSRAICATRQRNVRPKLCLSTRGTTELYSWLMAATFLLAEISRGMSLLTLTHISLTGNPLTNRHTRFQSASDVSPVNSSVPTDSILHLKHQVNGVSTKEEENTQQRHLRFSGVGRLYLQGGTAANIRSEDAHLSIVDRLARSTVAVVGLGGVGSWAAEALCRSGVGNIILIDMDDICISNTNRQLHATSSTVGQLKIEEMRTRMLDINPQCNVTSVFDFITTDNVDSIVDSLLPELSVCLDAIDGSKEKTALIAACVSRKVPIVTCGGAAGRLDPTRIVCDDITNVSGDRLLATCRRELRKRYGFERGIPMSKQRQKGCKPKKWGIQAVFSTEATPTKALPVHGGSSLRRCDGALGTACFVTGTVGFVAAGKVVDMIVNT